MPTVRLIPSSYSFSSSTYLSISNATNMYTDTDSTTYATITNTQSGTTSYYLYIRGFNLDDIPDGAVVDSFSIKFKARETGGSTSTSYRPYLVNGTSALTSTASALSTSTQTIEFSGYSLTWDDIVSYGSNFGVRINCRRASRNTTAYFYIYGAEIEVTYTIPVYHTLTVIDNGYSVDPTGENTVIEGSTQKITISETQMPTVTLNGSDITSHFSSQSLATSYEGYPASYTVNSISSGSSYASYAIGYSADSPNSSTNNYYGSSSATVDSQYVQYAFDLSAIPSTAADIQVNCSVAGHAESSTYSHQSGGRYSVWALCCNGTTKSEQIYTTSTSVTKITFSDTGSWTRSELDGLQLRHYVGYYGGLTNGATLSVTYTLPDGDEVYVYELYIDGDYTVILQASSKPVLYFKQNGIWKQVSVYKKDSGSYSAVSSIADIFEGFNSGDTTKYIKPN